MKADGRISSTQITQAYILAVYIQHMIIDRADDVAHIGPILMDIPNHHCPTVIIRAINIDLGKSLTGIQLGLDAGTEGTVCGFLHINGFVFYFISVRQRILIHRVGKCYGKTVSLSHAIPCINLTGIAIAKR